MLHGVGHKVRAGFSEEAIVEVEDEQEFSRSDRGRESIPGIGNCVCNGPRAEGHCGQQASVSESDDMTENG